MGQEHVKFGVDIEHVVKYASTFRVDEPAMLDLVNLAYEEANYVLKEEQIQRFFLDQKKNLNLPLTDAEQILDKKIRALIRMI